MNLNRPVSLIVLSTSLVSAFLAGTWYDRRAAAANGLATGRRILHYVDPMHPAYKSDKPGIAPDCGMQLVPVYAGGQLAAANSIGASSSLLPGAVQIDPARQQLFGVRVASVEQSSANYKLRLIGRVAP